MPDRHASVVEDSAVAPVLSKRMTEAENIKHIAFTDLRGDANIVRPVDYYIYVYNIAQREFEIRRPPLHALIKYAACPPGEPYIKVARYPNVIQEPIEDLNTGEYHYFGIRGERFAMDLINPVNIGIDMWAEVKNEELTWIDSGTNDLSVRGLFWTVNDPPADWELARSKQRLENFYRRKLEQGRKMSQTDKGREQIGPEHHMAAEYFHIKENWHTVAELPALCPNCGEVLPLATVAYHKNSMGDRCVIDWKRAVEAGAIKMEEVPEGKRWKKS